MIHLEMMLMWVVFLMVGVSLLPLLTGVIMGDEIVALMLWVLPVLVAWILVYEEQ